MGVTGFEGFMSYVMHLVIATSSINLPIIFMVALDHSAVVVRLAALDDLSHLAVDFKHPLLS